MSVIKNSKKHLERLNGLVECSASLGLFAEPCEMVLVGDESGPGDCLVRPRVAIGKEGTIGGQLGVSTLSMGQA